MKRDNIIQEKSFAFAVRIVKLSCYLRNEKHAFVLSRQILRSGTSIGANTEEAIGAQSRADFISKLAIAYKEARETMYWIKLLIATGYLSEEKSKALFSDVEELLKIIGSIQITAKANI